MIKKCRSLLLGITVLSMLSCKETQSEPSGAHYEKEVLQWQKEREAGLKSKDGWLNLAGLYWLKQGVNTLGSDSIKTMVFPLKAPANLGEITMEDDIVIYKANQNAPVFYQDSLIEEIQLYPVSKDIILRHEQLEWFLIKRGDDFAIRLKDFEHPRLKEFKGIKNYPIDEKWRVKAKFYPYANKEINIADVTGRTSSQEIAGELRFKIEGKAYSLDVLEEGDKLFILFGDQTNRNETYPSGRFLYTDKPNEKGFVWIDFNKSFNPPCAFQPYSTCPLPPQQNQMNIAVKAGEMQYEG